MNMGDGRNVQRRIGRRGLERRRGGREDGGEERRSRRGRGIGPERLRRRDGMRALETHVGAPNHPVGGAGRLADEGDAIVVCRIFAAGREMVARDEGARACLLYTSPSPRDS